MNMVFIALMKKDGKIAFADKFCHSAGGGKGASDKGREPVGVNGFSKSSFCHAFSILVHQ